MAGLDEDVDKASSFLSSSSSSSSFTSSSSSSSSSSSIFQFAHLRGRWPIFLFLRLILFLHLLFLPDHFLLFFLFLPSSFRLWQILYLLLCHSSACNSSSM